MDAIAEARVLLGDYNKYRLQTASIVGRRSRGEWVGKYLKETPKRLELFSDTAQWCRDHKIDPRLWIYLLFRSRSWTYAPKLVPGHLMSEAMFAKYGWLSRRSLDGYRSSIAAKTHSQFDPNKDISFAAEALKGQYAKMQQLERCMRETMERTLGFHPKSEHCCVCPMRVPCEIQLRQLTPEFDIVALRRGELSVVAAQAAVAAGSK